MLKSYFWEDSKMSKMNFCPKCNLKMRKTTVKKISTGTGHDEGSFGMFSYFKPVNLGGTIEYSQQVLVCPKCGRSMPVVKPEKRKVKRTKTGKMSKFWKVVLILLAIAIVLAAAAFVLYKTGHMPQRVIDLVKTVKAHTFDRVMNFLRARF